MQSANDSSPAGAGGHLRCPSCGYSLTGLPEMYRCPECSFLYVAGVTATSEYKARRFPVLALFGTILGELVLIGLAGWMFMAALFQGFWRRGLISRDPIERGFYLVLTVLVLGCIAAHRVLTHISAGTEGRFRVDKKGIWIRRGRLAELIPWQIVRSVCHDDVERRVLLELTIGEPYEIPRRTYWRRYGPGALQSVLMRALRRHRAGAAAEQSSNGAPP